jgi:hypothetical protein
MVLFYNLSIVFQKSNEVFFNVVYIVQIARIHV